MNFSGKNPLWISVLEAALEDRIDFLRRLLERPMKYATEDEITLHTVAVDSARRQLEEVINDLEKARGEA